MPATSSTAKDSAVRSVAAEDATIILIADSAWSMNSFTPPAGRSVPGSEEASSSAARRRADCAPGLDVLIADRVHDHARVVHILEDHRFQVVLPPPREVQRVVECGLSLGPYIEGLVDDEH